MSIYRELYSHYDGIQEERELERMVVAFLKEFSGEGDVFEYVEIYAGLRGLPLIFSNFKSDSADGDAIDEARRKSSHIVVMCNNYMESDGSGVCSMTVSYKHDVLAGEVLQDGEVQKYEEIASALRGVFSFSGQIIDDFSTTVGRVNMHSDKVRVGGWAPVQPSTDEFDGQAWIFSQEYEVAQLHKVLS